MFWERFIYIHKDFIISFFAISRHIDICLPDRIPFAELIAFEKVHSDLKGFFLVDCDLW